MEPVVGVVTGLSFTLALVALLAVSVTIALLLAAHMATLHPPDEDAMRRYREGLRALRRVRGF
jgi:membrane protein implicated in regulation of membrane protease activity